MAQSPRVEIPNGHVPLAFLLGRRASEYSLPCVNQSLCLATHQPLAHGSVLARSAHVRQREQQARALLERVLAREVRLDTKNKAEYDTALAPPPLRVSSADRRRRAAELQRVLDERTETGDCTLVKSRDETDPSNLYRGFAQDPCQRRDQFASYHGYAPDKPDFVEVVGHGERIQRTQSLRELHDGEKRKRVKQLMARQSRVETLRNQLQQQQIQTKHKLKLAAHRLRGSVPAQEAEQEEEAAATLKQNALQKAEPKLCAQQQWEVDKARLLEEHELQERHESVQRRRLERQTLQMQRRAKQEYEKSFLAKLAGPGPSFQSTLRVEGEDFTSSRNHLPQCCPLFLHEELEAAATEETVAREPGARLQKQQHAVFARSRLRSLQVGGGFGSKPHSSRLLHETNKPKAHEDCHGIATHAASVGAVKSKREIVADWKTTLSQRTQQQLL